MDLPTSSVASLLLLPLPPVPEAHLLADVDTSGTLIGAAALYAGDGDHRAVHRFGNANHNGKAQEFGVAAVWFPAFMEDVLVSPAHVRPFALAYLRPLTRVRVFSSSFTKISCRASSSYATVADPGSSTSFAAIATITCRASSSSAPRPSTRPRPPASQ